MDIRCYNSGDLELMARLFCDTIRAVNSIDYSAQQIEVWANCVNLAAWDVSFRKNITYVATENDLIVGFGDIDENGYLDMLYVHKDFQRRGVAAAICNRLEAEVGTNVIMVHASITAKPFFEKRGYRTLQSQEVERQGVLLTNFVMQKDIADTL